MFENDELVTVWSAPNYCYRCGNVASIMEVKDAEFEPEKTFKIFHAVPDQERLAPARTGFLGASGGSGGQYFM